MGVRSIRRLVPLFGLLIVAASIISAGASGHGAATPKVVGNAVVGKAAFTKAGCGSCHALAAAKSKGTIGPSLDSETLTEAKIVTQITNGGYGVMGAAAKKTYPFPMSPFKGKLTTAQIQNIAAFVFSKRTGKVAAAASASSSSTSSSSSSGSGSTAAPTTTTTAQPGSAPAAPVAPAANNGCPTGVTIGTSGSTDNDGDENGDPTDNDGCI